MLDWLIIGGGIHGTYLSHVLIEKRGITPSGLRVLDPHEEPMADFWRCTSVVGMRHLRSPVVHHLGIDPFSLRRFAKRQRRAQGSQLYYPYERPGLELFRAHTKNIIERHGLGQVRMRGCARRLRRLAEGFRIETSAGHVDAKRVVLALGQGQELGLPSWSAAGSHIFDPEFRLDRVSKARQVIVVGGGISAAQMACRLASSGVLVTVVCRHSLREHIFDSDPGWLGPKHMSAFSGLRNWAERRRVISAARHRGSVPPEVAAELRRQRQLGRIRWIQGSVLDANLVRGGVQVQVDADLEVLSADHLVLCTGYAAARPGGKFVDGLVEHLDLRCAPCGYPIVDAQLRWCKGLYVTGALAELQLGPTARNIAGARASVERLLGVH